MSVTMMLTARLRPDHRAHKQRRVRPRTPFLLSGTVFPSEPAALKSIVERRLDALLPSGDRPPHRLHQAMRHVLLAPGKRLRPLLALLSARQCGSRDGAALDVACALEMVHAASLVLDDLPCMDDAETRRGRPTAHKAFGEDIAILAAVGLLNQAYGVLAACQRLDRQVKVELTGSFARMVGAEGLLGGQEFDLRDRTDVSDPETIRRFNRAKTGVLIETAVDAGALVGEADVATRAALGSFARHLGDAFQMLDDMIDALSTASEAGKDVGQDEGRITLVTLHGAAGARDRVLAEIEAGCAALERAPCGPDPLAGYARATFAQVMRL